MVTKVAFGCGLGGTRAAEVCVARPAIRPVRRRRGGTKDSAAWRQSCIGSAVRPNCNIATMVSRVKQKLKPPSVPIGSGRSTIHRQPLKRPWHPHRTRAGLLCK
jgi:hypothetical protein